MMKQVSVSVQSIMQQELAAWLTCLLDKFQAGLAAERRPAAATDPPAAGWLVCWSGTRGGLVCLWRLPDGWLPVADWLAVWTGGWLAAAAPAGDRPPATDRPAQQWLTPTQSRSLPDCCCYPYM